MCLKSLGRCVYKSESNLKTLDLGKQRKQANASGQNGGIIELTGKELISCYDLRELLGKVQFLKC